MKKRRSTFSYSKPPTGANDTVIVERRLPTVPAVEKEKNDIGNLKNNYL